MKKLLSILLTLTMILSPVGSGMVTAYASEEAIAAEAAVEEQSGEEAQPAAAETAAPEEEPSAEKEDEPAAEQPAAAEEEAAAAEEASDADAPQTAEETLPAEDPAEEGSEAEAKTLTGITVDTTEAKTEYTFGLDTELDFTGLIVTAKYSDESTLDLEDGTYTIDDELVDLTVADTYVVTVSYTEGDVTVTADFGVVVAPALRETSAGTVLADRQYVIVAGEHALSNITSPNTAQGGSSSYTYTGLTGVPYASGDGADDSIRWIFEETEGGYYILSRDGRYLNATYISGDNSAHGDLKLDNTPDVWVLDEGYSFDSGAVDGSKLKSSNASATASSDKYLGYEESPVNLFTVRSLGYADPVTIEEAGEPVAVTDVTLDKATAEIEVRQTLQLTATIAPDNATNRNVTWTSSDTDIATVDETGKVMGVTEGTATITVTTVDGGKTAACEVTVNPATQKYYVIKIGNHALSTEESDELIINSGDDIEIYYYTGLAGVDYAGTDDVVDEICWIIEETSGGYFIRSLDGRYLNATYISNDTGGSTGALKLDQTQDIWTIDGSLDDWTINGSRLKSTNASANGSSDKYLSYGDGTAGTTLNLFTIRSESRAGQTTIIEVEEPTPVSRYTVTFVNWDGTELQSSQYEAGATPEFTGTAPTKAPDAQYIYQFTGWTPEIAPVTGDATYTATYTEVLKQASLYGASLRMTGDIGVNFYYEFMDSFLEDGDAYISVKVGDGAEKKLKISEAAIDRKSVAGKTLYKFTCYVAAKQMKDTILIQAHATGYEGQQYTYSIRKYADNILAKASYAAEVKYLVRVMMHYGTSAQKQLNYQIGDLAEAGLDVSDIIAEANALTAEDLSAYEMSKTEMPEGITVYGANLSLQSETVLRYYFEVEEGHDISEYTFKVDGKGGYTPVLKSGKYCIEISNVKAQDLDHMYTVSVTDGNGNSGSETYGALTYVRNTLAKGTESQELTDICRSLYMYNKAAEAYLATKGK